MLEKPEYQCKTVTVHPSENPSCHANGCDTLSKGRYDETFAGEDGENRVDPNQLITNAKIC